MVEGIFKVQWYKNCVVGMKFFIVQDCVVLGFFLQGQKGVQGVVDVGEGQGIVNGVNNLWCGGFVVEEGYLMGFQQCGCMVSGMVFFFDQLGFLIVEQIMGGVVWFQYNVFVEQYNWVVVVIEVVMNGYF